MISQPGKGDAVLGHIYLLTDTYLGQTLTLRLAGMKPHINQLMEARLLNSSSQEEIALKTVESIPGDQFDGKNLASGVYYYQLVAGVYREVKKMILLR